MATKLWIYRPGAEVFVTVYRFDETAFSKALGYACRNKNELELPLANGRTLTIGANLVVNSMFLIEEMEDVD